VGGSGFCRFHFSKNAQDMGEKNMSSASVWDNPTPTLERPAQSQWSRVTSLVFAAPWVLDALDRVADLARLPRNWDGYGSPQIDPSAIASARRFVANVAFDSLPFPHVVPVLGGSVGLHWRCGDRELEFTFHPEGTVGFLKVLGVDLDRDENLEEGTLRRDQETVGLKFLLWMVGAS
jgi:hypothetical protein